MYCAVRRCVVWRRRDFPSAATAAAAAASSSDSKSGSGSGVFGLTVYGSVISLDGARCVDGQVRRTDLQFVTNTGSAAQLNAVQAAANALGVELGQQLKAAGADAILAEIKG